ncbi:phosphatidate phosphatase LPIN3 isoform X1 [Spea bombifrons]|uniref:phosphatidate phosphatase LPIN3 isoform X1 n=1 Tax=Spea bombifrons TaxID=233779 RepID=UPI00234A3D35|nr:phosphatidate phosphatase LPIN3 isoform X1 [Spea bombifrons]
MNYVGQLAGSVLGRVRDLYNGVNPATLSGSIDVVVIRQPDGSFRSSPFHVRFGKLGILHSAEMGVDIEVNGEPVDLQMRLGENGEAFFLQEMETNECSEAIPPSTTCSPLLQKSPQLHQTSVFDPPMPPADPHALPSSSDTPTKRQRWVQRARRISEERSSGTHEEDQNNLFSARDSMYFSFCDVPEQLSPSQSTDFFACSDEELPIQHLSRSPSPKSDSELELRPPNSPFTEQSMEWDWGRFPQLSRSELTPQMSQSAPPSPTNKESPLIRSSQLLEQRDPLPTKGQENCVSQVNKALADPPDLPEMFDQRGQLLVETQSELSTGPPNPAPEEVLSPESQEVSLYFPNSDPHPPPAPPNKQNVSQQALDEHLDTLESQQKDSMALSLCGGLTDSWDIAMEIFLKHQISYFEFCQNPSLIEDPRLVVRIEDKFYNWAAAAPIILCMQVFNRELPQGAIDQLSQQKMPPRSRGWWFSWRRRNLPEQPQVSKPNEEQNEDSSQHSLAEKEEEQSEALFTTAQRPQYQRSLRLTSEQIKRLNLRNGANEVVFSVCTKFQGTCRTRAEVYLWDSNDRIIVSDIDGTVTRSDTLGHILPQIGKDWTQQGIVQLYHAIHRNGYNFVYCSARSVGLAELTKNFLQRISEGGCSLPPGPLLLSPSSLFTALHREVILKTPEHFKISCLSDIRQLFPDPQPFYAAFGNRHNDVVAYKEVGVPESRIFTVNPKGELAQEMNSSFKSSYSALCELVNVMFPPLSSSAGSAMLSSEFGQFSFWRDAVASVSEEELSQIS